MTCAPRKTLRNLSEETLHPKRFVRILWAPLSRANVNVITLDFL